jgi:two-component system response regulator HydG
MMNKAGILVVDDQAEMARTVAEGLSLRGFMTKHAGSGVEALNLLRSEPFDALVTDLRMPGGDGMSLLEASKQLAPDRPVIIMTAYSAIDTAIESIRRGAYHYLTKPFKVEELALFLERALDEVRLRSEAASLRRALRGRGDALPLVGSSEPMNQVRDFVTRVADAPAPVLILGETGTGKSLIARAIHANRSSTHGEFVQINCAALPEQLLESELFGHTKGAFTGATADRSGLFAQADGGTLFLDEIAELASGLQAKLLDVLERGVIRPVGSNRERAVQARIIAATNQDLRAPRSERTFREDLLYRLDVLTVTAPALRDRTADLPELVAHFIAESRSRYPRSPVESMSAAALARLSTYEWPGNVRELAHMIERLVLLGSTKAVDVDHLPERVREQPPASPVLQFGGEVMPMKRVQRLYASWAVSQMGGNRTRAAEVLDVDVKTLRSWLAQET